MNKHLQSLRNSLLIVPCVAIAFSYFTQLSLLFSGIYVCLFIAITQTLHLPEEMPGGYDNLDGEELHPKWVLLTTLGSSVFLYLLGWKFPSLTKYVAFVS